MLLTCRHRLTWHYRMGLEGHSTLRLAAVADIQEDEFMSIELLATVCLTGNHNLGFIVLAPFINKSAKSATSSPIPQLSSKPRPPAPYAWITLPTVLMST